MMSFFNLIISSLKHYFKSNLYIAFGFAISTAIITGALIVGDSVRYSLEQTVHYRLGNITHSITAGDRFFTEELAGRMAGDKEFHTSAGLVLEGLGLADGGQLRLNQLQILGVDDHFAEMFNVPANIFQLEASEAIISENVAARLNLQQGDMLLLRIKKASLIPLNAPLVSDAEQTIARQVRIKSVAGKESFGRFNLQASQTAPYNVFVSLEWLNEVMDLNRKANIIFVRGTLRTAKHEIESKLQQEWHIEDGNIQLEYLSGDMEMEITSERVFIDTVLSSKILEALPEARPILTYFVNSMRYGTAETPYSFISTLPDSLLSDDEMIINDWVAEDIRVQTQDTLQVEYFIIGPLRELNVRQSRFVVKDIVSVRGQYGDQSLMPDLPGLSDAGSCREWEAGIPIDLEKIRDKDEDYWNKYRGSPKAFISVSKARKIWGNRFGDFTAIRISREYVTEQQVKDLIRSRTGPLSLGFQINEVKTGGLQAAGNGVDFSQLFLGLSFFIMVSGIILAALLVVFNLEQRSEQIGTYAAMGFSHKLIRRIYQAEGLFVGLLGSIAGVLLAVFYSKLVFVGLNRVWQDIVRTDILEMTVKTGSLAAGFFISALVSWLITVVLLRRHLRFSVVHLQKKSASGYKPWLGKVKLVIIVTLTLICLGLLSWQLARGGLLNPTVFFVCGAMFLLVFLLLSDLLMLKIEANPSGRISMTTLSYKNLVRNRRRSLTVIILLSLGAFTVISTGSNRKDLSSEAQKETSGTGGFMFLAESTVPILKNLNATDVRNEIGIPDSLYFVQFRVHEGDDASCLNLNRVVNPRILGVNHNNLTHRFSFVTRSEELDVSDPWTSLNEDLGDVFPAIADQTVIQWGLGKKVGDTLIYVGETGDTVRLKLIGGLANSIFQGNVIISQDNFLKIFPTSVGTNFFLIDGNHENLGTLGDELGFVFRDFGWDMVPAVARLAEYATVQDTYLQIFLVMGAFGLLLGTIGLAVVVARSMHERKNELAIIRSAGFPVKNVYGILFREYAIILLAGIAAGLLASVISTLPSFLAGNQNVSIRLLVILTGTIMLNGIFWIGLISGIQLRKMNLVAALRND